MGSFQGNETQEHVQTAFNIFAPDRFSGFTLKVVVLLSQFSVGIVLVRFCVAPIAMVVTSPHFY